MVEGYPEYMPENEAAHENAQELERCQKCSRKVPSAELEANGYLCSDCAEF